MKIGRSNDYKSDPSCLYIGDLKVPKRYISVKLGLIELREASVTPLIIQFQSICTTDINGRIFKLKKKEDDPIDIAFTDRTLLLKVNANKSDLIQIRIHWVDVTLLFPCDSPLTERKQLLEIVNKYYSKGLDLRICEHPCKATYVLALSSKLETSVQECVLRGIPIVSEKWLRHAWENLNDPYHWLTTVAEKLLFPSDYSHPNSARSKILQEKAVIACYNAKSAPKLKAFLSWMQAFLPITVHEVDIEDVNAIAKISEIARNTKNVLYIFQLGRLTAEFDNSPVGKFCNTLNDLWAAVVAADESKIRRTSIVDLEFDNLLKREATAEDTGKPVQRKRRRKIERVNETDFFLFSLSVAPTQIDLSSQPLSEENSGTEPLLIQETAGAEQPKTVIDAGSSTNNLHNFSEILADDAQIQASNSFKTEPLDVSKSLVFLEPEQKNISGDESNSSSKPNEQHEAKNKTINSVSLTEAIISTKHKAEEGIKSEFYEGEPLEEGIENLVIIEEIVLHRSKKATEAVSTNSTYQGRKNFKAFRKARIAPHYVTRTYIQLYDENQINVKKEPVGKVSDSCRYVNDFAEMGTVHGYQPESQLLFVAEESDNGHDDDQLGFLSTKNSHIDIESGDESDDDIRFKFST